jgi:parallel beta-helix repeat protein
LPAAVVVLAATLTAGAWEGPAAGNASAKCTKTLTAGHSLNRFVRRLHAGEIGCLRGTFHQDLTIRRSGFHLKSAPGRRARIDGVVYFARTAHDVVLSRLVLRDTGGPSVRINGTAITIRRSDISNRHTGICVSVGGAFERWGIAVGVTLAQNRIHDCGRLPATNHDHGIYVEGSRATTIRGNLIYDNADRGVQLYPDAQGTIVVNNVIDGNGEGVIFAGESAGGEYRRSYASSGNLVTRNIISNSSERHNVESWWGGPIGIANVVRDNCLWNGAQGNLDLSAGGFLAIGNRIAQPGFVDRAAKDFRLRPGSPCAGMGPH